MYITKNNTCLKWAKSLQGNKTIQKKTDVDSKTQINGPIPNSSIVKSAHHSLISSIDPILIH